MTSARLSAGEGDAYRSMVTVTDPGHAARREAVWRCFALGWDVSSLFLDALEAPLALEVGEGLPGLNRLPLATLVGLGLDEMNASLEALNGLVGVVALRHVETAGVRDALADLVAAGDSCDRSALRQAILELHVKVLTSLTAADSSCGKAYRLGRVLSDTCSALQSAAQLSNSLSPDRMAMIGAWLDDLKSLLPDHAADAVSNSLDAWADWAYLHSPMPMTSQDVSSVGTALHAQGQRWRALLSSEKSARDALELEDHATIVRRTLPYIWRLGFVPALWLPFSLVTGLLGLGVALAVTSNNAARVIAGLGMIAISVVVTWRTAALVVARVDARLGEPIWGAECNRMIAERVTRVPTLPAGASGRRFVARSAPGPQVVNRPPGPLTPLKQPSHGPPPPPRPTPPHGPPPPPRPTPPHGPPPPPRPQPVQPPPHASPPPPAHTPPTLPGEPGPVPIPQGSGSSFYDDDTITVDLSGHYANDDPGQDEPGPAL